MKKLLFSSLLAVGLLAVSSTASAASAGQLIKASTPSVYYLAQDGKRYTFPTEKTYLSWYNNFDNVQTITDAELASYPLGGNVTYRPGTRLVKVTTDPKVYAIGHGSELRWVQTEALASALFGSSWATQIDDIPDAFFVNYKLGASIAANSDFSRATEQELSTNIQSELTAKVTSSQPSQPTTPTTPTSTTPTQPPASGTSTGLLMAPDTARVGERFTMNISADKSNSISEIKIYVDDSLLQTCSNVACSVEYQIPGNSSKSSYILKAAFRWITGETFVATKTVTVVPGVAGVNLLISNRELKPSGQREFVVRLDPSVNAYNTVIVVNSSIVKGCSQLRECRYTEPENQPIGTSYPVYGEITDQQGQTMRTEVATISVVANPHPTITVLTAKNTIYKGETIDITVNAQDEDGITATEVWADGQLLKSCTGQSCTATTGPWNISRTITFTGKATDATGLTSSASSSVVTVQ